MKGICLVTYTVLNTRSAAGFGGEWDADRRHAMQRRRSAQADRGRVWARVKSVLALLTPVPTGEFVIAR